MAKTEKPEAPAKAERKPRTILTGAERIAKMEAEVEALRKKEEAKADKVKAASIDKRAALVVKRNALNVQIAELNALIGDDIDVPPPLVEPSDS